MTKRTYIAGPITGRDWKKVKDHFESASHHILEEGLIPVSPTDDSISRKCPFQSESRTRAKEIWQWYMREGLKLLLSCDEIYMLRGWQKSEGATWERQVAQRLGMDVYYEEEG